MEVNKKTEKELKELNRQQKKQRKRQLILANEEEKKNIQQLEKQLGMKKRKSKNLPKCFLDDGLDYILDACDSAKLGAMGDLSEDEDGGKDLKNRIENDDSSDSEEDLIEGVDYDFKSDEEKDDMNVEESDDEDNVENEVTEGSDDDENPDISEADGGTERDSIESEITDSKQEIWEDIYGRKRNIDGTIVKDSVPVFADTSGSAEPSKYIPPAMRNKSSLSESEEKKIALSRLSKQLKGLLNRLAETNMHGIARQVEGFYRQFSRNDVNMTLTGELCVWSPYSHPHLSSY